jgi:ERCC4-related helicase
MVRFKIAFTIDAKTLFSYLSQALPTLENLHVEEVIERTPEERFVKNYMEIKTVNKIKRSRQKRGPNLDEGINKIIMDILIDGAIHNATEFIEPISKTKYSQNSIQSRLIALNKAGVVNNTSKGNWKLTEKYLQK